MNDQVNNPNHRPLKLAILQRVCTAYRRDLMLKMASSPGLQVRVFIGDNLPNSKVRSATDFKGLDVVRHKSWFLPVKRSHLPYHFGLLRSLRAYQPDVILCEGESHALGYLKALLYRFSQRQTGLIYWTQGGVPGEKRNPGRLRRLWITNMQRRFDRLIVYSTFGKEFTEQHGIDGQKIVVATNVGDTERFLHRAESLELDKTAAREKIGLPERFTVLYVGQLDPDKKPDLLLEVARHPDMHQVNFVFAGDGQMLQQLREQAEGLENVFLPGRINDGLDHYYGAANALVAPGQAGIVFSEGMAFSLPLLVGQSDGTEFDLIEQSRSGLRIFPVNVENFRGAILDLALAPERAQEWGERGHEMIRGRFSQMSMAATIVDTVRTVAGLRNRNLRDSTKLGGHAHES